jgi:diguanylate cyclase (GGDEF)-like protein/PAS domain S-box-containing protein
MEHPLLPGADARRTARPLWSRAAHPTIPELAARAMALETAVARLALAAQAPDADPASVLAAGAAALEAEGAALLGLDARAGTLVWLAGAPPDAKPLVLRELPALAARLARLEPAWIGAEAPDFPQEWRRLRAAGLGRVCLVPVRDTSAPARVLLVHGLRAEPSAAQRGLYDLIAGLCAQAWRSAEQAATLQRAEERFELSQLGSTAAFFEWDVAGQRIWWSPQLRTLLGYGPEDPADRVLWRDLVHPDDIPRVEAALSAHLDGMAERFDLVYRCRRKDGSAFWTWGRLTARRRADGSLSRILGTLLDISDQVRIEDALHRAEVRAGITLAAIGDAVLTTDAAGCIEYLNPAAEALTGWSASTAQGRHLEEVVRLHDGAERVPRPLQHCLTTGAVLRLEEAMQLQAGRATPSTVAATLAPIHDRAGARAGCVLVLRDVTEQRELAQRLAYQASHDALTGLVNRREFESRLAAALSDPAPHALMYLDLDHFKVVNDSCGHAAGDALLRQLGDLLRSAVPEGATVARLGGDEFGVLVPEAADPAAVAETLRDAVARSRFHWEGRVFRLGVSIGRAPVTRGASVAELLAAADTACFAAKDAGRDRIHAGGPDDAESRRRRGELGWVARLQAALDADRLVLWRQEIRAFDGSASHHELLLRLLDEQGRLIPPDLFVPAAERHGLMGALDRWVVEHAFAWLAAAPDAGVHAINLSGQTLSDPGFLPWVEAAFQRHALAPARVCFEVTETAAIAQLAPALSLMQALRAQGCRFALDDFGAGMASFAYLRRLPVDLLKIDGSFVRRVHEDALDRELVRAANGLGHLLGMRTVAEYAEDATIIATLRELGVDYAQGYGIGHPAPLPGSASDQGRGLAARV